MYINIKILTFKLIKKISDAQNQHHHSVKASKAVGTS